MSGPVYACRACGGALSVTMADLGLQPPSNAFLPADAPASGEKLYPLRAKVCDTCRLVQVDYDVDPRELFGNYVYFSSYSDDWLTHAQDYCRMAQLRFGLGTDSLVVELASNDGYLLKNFVEMGIPVLGIDPSETVARAAIDLGVPTLVEFFGVAQAHELVAAGRRADLVIGNNVLAHVPAINDFVAGIAIVLKDEGTVTIEFPHLLKLIEHVEFDTIYHEHFSYISLLAIERVFGRHGLRICDVDELPTHGGSLRIYACHAARQGLPDSAALAARAGRRGRRRARRVAHVLAVRGAGRGLPHFGAQLPARSRARRTASVAGYGAAAKGNTLLNSAASAPRTICLRRRSQSAQARQAAAGQPHPGRLAEELMRAPPDYVLILPGICRTRSAPARRHPRVGREIRDAGAADQDPAVISRPAPSPARGSWTSIRWRTSVGSSRARTARTNSPRADSLLHSARLASPATCAAARSAACITRRARMKRRSWCAAPRARCSMRSSTCAAARRHTGAGTARSCPPPITARCTCPRAVRTASSASPTRRRCCT